MSEFPKVVRVIDRGQVKRQSGGALVGLLLALLIVFAVWKTLPLLTATSAPTANQAPSALSIDGPTRIRVGGTATFFVTLRYSGPVDAGSGHKALVEISTDPYGDAVLDREARVILRDGATSGTGSFALSCEDLGNGDFSLNGDDGNSRSDGTWQLYGRVLGQSAAEGGGLSVICG